MGFIWIRETEFTVYNYIYRIPYAGSNAAMGGEEKMRRKNDHKKLALTVGFLCLLIGALGLIILILMPQEELVTVDSPSKPESLLEVSQPEPQSEPEPEPEPVTATILMVGDNLLHMEVVDSGLQGDGTYDFTHLFESIYDDVQSADIAIINQETVLGGTEIGLSGYPQFNSPQEMGDFLLRTGFNVVLHANNHAMDRHYNGLERTMDFWDQHPEVTVVGINRTQEDRGRIRLVNANGIQVAVLGYTYGTNGIPLPEDMPWLVNLIDEDMIREDILKAKELADFIVVLPHWGVEYSYSPSDEQVYLASMMADLGVDLIIGTHPHVLQPIDWIERTDGGRTLVYYSLGNYVSNQNMNPRMLGGMARITITMDGDKVSITDASIEPLVTHYEWSDIRGSYYVYKLEDYSQELAARHGVGSSDTGFSLAYLQDLSRQILGAWYQEKQGAETD